MKHQNAHFYRLEKIGAERDDEPPGSSRWFFPVRKWSRQWRICRIMSGERTTRELKRQGARSSRRRLQPGLRAGRDPESRTCGGGFCHEDFTPFRGTSLEDSTCTPRKKPIDPNRFFSTHIGPISVSLKHHRPSPQSINFSCAAT